MFTGIIEDIGTVHSLKKGKSSMELSIRSEKILEDVHLGDSISVNGVCLTVTSFTKSLFTVDVMPETVKASSIRTLKLGITCESRTSHECTGKVWRSFCFRSYRRDRNNHKKRTKRKCRILCNPIGRRAQCLLHSKRLCSH